MENSALTFASIKSQLVLRNFRLGTVYTGYFFQPVRVQADMGTKNTQRFCRFSLRRSLCSISRSRRDDSFDKEHTFQAEHAWHCCLRRKVCNHDQVHQRNLRPEFARSGARKCNLSGRSAGDSCFGRLYFDPPLLGTGSSIRIASSVCCRSSHWRNHLSSSISSHSILSEIL